MVLDAQTLNADVQARSCWLHTAWVDGAARLLLQPLWGLLNLRPCAGLSFDIAIRMYLESFRLPGEAQKINRIMETFGAHYHRQCPDIFRNADAVYVLAYSVIILNTDQHNNQVRCQLLPHGMARLVSMLLIGCSG